jgi:hypothetical protein
MLFCSNKYLYHSGQKNISSLVLLMIFSFAGYAQITPLQRDTAATFPLSPLFFSSYKKPNQPTAMHINPPYKPFVLRKGGELMHWPNYPLTAGQIIARQADWQRRNSQTLGEQIASDIIKNRVNAWIYGKKMPVAVVPKF